MGRLRTFGVVALLAALATAAAAADMPDMSPPPSMQWHPEPRSLIDLNSGWYLRGDLGYSWSRLNGAEAAPGFINPTDNALGNTINAGAGGGFKSHWLRADVTIDYLSPMKYTGTVATPGDVAAKISALSALFNGYLDLGTWYHVTPYIGAGVGAAHTRVSDYASTADPPFIGGARQRWGFAWAAMAGVGIPVAPNLMIDVGYRYIDFGNIGTVSDSFGNMTFKNVAAQEVRLGLRWSFEDSPAEK